MAMTQNGNNQARIEGAEALLRAAAQMAVPAPADVNSQQKAAASVMSLMTALAERCRNQADALVTAADDDRKEAYDFSNHLIDLARKWGEALLKRKRQELAELEAFLGKIGK